MASVAGPVLTVPIYLAAGAAASIVQKPVAKQAALDSNYMAVPAGVEPMDQGPAEAMPAHPPQAMRPQETVGQTSAAAPAPLAVRSRTKAAEEPGLPVAQVY